MKYLVKSDAVVGLGNKTYYKDQEVQSGNFPAGNAEEMVLSGSLERIEPSVKKVAKPAPAPKATVPATKKPPTAKKTRKRPARRKPAKRTGN